MERMLHIHPDSHCAAVRRIEADIAHGEGVLVIVYRVSGKIAGIDLPPAAASARADELWKHTCFEVFIRGAGEAYTEFNFSPATQWAAYQFESYRGGMRNAEVTRPRINVRQEGDTFELRAALDLSGLALPGALQLAVSAVIEETSGGKSYWALAHPQGAADFHHADGFALELPKA